MASRRIPYILVIGSLLLISVAALLFLDSRGILTNYIDQDDPSIPAPLIELKDPVQHIVAPGENLLIISRMYGVSIQRLVRANGFFRTLFLKSGDTLIVPGARYLKPLVPLFRNDRWKYLIVHHSATASGSALVFEPMHIKRGFGGVGYHFIIDNGTYGKYDGEVEVTPRWLKQQVGAHTSAQGMNYKAIGICLVGNFDETVPSDKQLESLAYILKRLSKYYNIPKENIIGHTDAAGPTTHCPGSQFPWEKLRSML